MTRTVQKGLGGMPGGLVLTLLAGMIIVGCGKDADKDKGGGAGKSADSQPAPPAALLPASQPMTAPASQAFTRFAVTRPAPKVFQLTPLASVQVKPSDAPQTLTFQDKVKVTLPPGLLREPAQLTLSQVKDPPEPGFTCFSALASYDVSIGKQRQFDKEIEIELAVEPSLFRKDIPPEALFTAAYFDAEEHQWVEVGCQADPASGKVTIRTRHLCLLQWWYLGIHYTIIGGGEGNNMGLAWDPGEVDRETVKSMHKYARVFPNDTPGLPDFVSDVRENASSALKKYRELGLDLHTKPLWIFITGERQSSSGHNPLTQNIFVTFTQTDPINLPFVVAHEMFHNIQMNKYDLLGVLARRWWTEVTATYAAARIVLEKYPNMGKQDQGARMFPRFLTVPVDYAATPKPDFWVAAFGKDENYHHAYQSAYFLEYLCRVGADLKRESEPDITPAKYFKRMWDFFPSDDADTLSSLNSFLIKQHAKNYTLPRQYERFVLHYLFEFDGPMLKVPGRGIGKKFRQEACEDLLVLSDSDKDLPTYAFTVDGGYTAKVAGLHVKPAQAGQTIGVSVELKGDLPGSTNLHVVHLPQDEYTPGKVTPIGSYQLPADSRQVFTANLAEEDGLYLAVVNTSSSSQTIRVKIRQCPLKIDSISPATTKPYSPIVIKGKGFGTLQPTNRAKGAEGLFYGTQRVFVSGGSATTKPWTDTEIRTSAPMPPGDKFTVKLNGMTSNAFPFTPEIGPMPPGDMEVRIFPIRLRNHKINLTGYLSAQILEGGVVHCCNGGPGPTTRPVLGQGTVRPNLAGEKNAGLYIWNIPFVYTYSDYPLVNGDQTLYTISAVISTTELTGTVTGGAMTSKPLPSGRRIIDIGKPVVPSAATTQPANQPDLSDEVWVIYNDEVAWCRVQGALEVANRQIKDYQQQIEEVGQFAPTPAPGGDVAALRTVINLLAQAHTGASKDFDAAWVKIWQAQAKLVELQTNRLIPPAMPYDRTKADLEEMDRQLRAQRTAKEAELAEKSKQVQNLRTQLDKACQAKTPAAPAASDELSRLRAEANRRQAELDLVKLRTAGRQKYLEDLTKQVRTEQSAADALAASIKAQPADAGAPFQTMVRLLPYLQRK